MNILGVDPGPDSNAYVLLSTELYVTPCDHNEWGKPHVAIIEWPVSIGIAINRKWLDATMRRSAVLAEDLHRAGIHVYTPPRQQIINQLGYSTKHGNADKWLRAHLAALGFDMKVLKNSHLRSALAAALFNHKHPVNAKHMYVGLN